MCQQQKGQPQSLSVLLQSCYMFNSLQLSSPAVLAAQNQSSYIAAAFSTSYNATKVPAGDLSVEQTSHRLGQTGHHNFLIRWLIRLGAWHSFYLTTSFPSHQKHKLSVCLEHSKWYVAFQQALPLAFSPVNKQSMISHAIFITMPIYCFCSLCQISSHMIFALF